MNKFLFSMSAIAAGLVAVAEPCVLEKGYKPPANQSGGETVSLLGELSADNAGNGPVEEKKAEEPAAEATAPEAAPAQEAEEPAAKDEKHTGKKSKEKKPAGRPAKITSDSTVYNRKEGIASFEGHVHVDDERYQMHADRVFLFMEGTNDLKRIVAIGNVAMTNEAHRAYGAKATYSKKNGLVVLYSGDGITAEVRDESKAQPQIVRGKRIRFWIDSEQVEVDEADLTGAAPSGGADSLKKALGK